MLKVLLWWWWWLWCRHDVMTMSLAIPSHRHATNQGGRTPGSQIPDVPATLGLNVQLDGVRKMLHFCSRKYVHLFQ